MENPINRIPPPLTIELAVAVHDPVVRGLDQAKEWRDGEDRPQAVQPVTNCRFHPSPQAAQVAHGDSIPSGAAARLDHGALRACTHERDKRRDSEMMDVKPLHNEQDYDRAIREITRYFEVEPALGTADGDRFEVLSILIKDYEDEHFAAHRRRRSSRSSMMIHAAALSSLSTRARRS